MAKIVLSNQFSALAQGKNSWLTDSTTPSQVITELQINFPQLYSAISDKNGGLKPFVTFVIDNVPCNEDFGKIKIKDDSVVLIISAVAGG